MIISQSAALITLGERQTIVSNICQTPYVRAKEQKFQNGAMGIL